MLYLYFSAFLVNLHKNFGLLRNFNEVVNFSRNFVWLTGKQVRIEVAHRKLRNDDVRALYIRSLSSTSKNFLLVSKMDSFSDRTEIESLAKRPKLDFSDSNEGVLCNGINFSRNSSNEISSIGPSEGKFYKICLIV